MSWAFFQHFFRFSKSETTSKKWLKTAQKPWVFKKLLSRRPPVPLPTARAEHLRRRDKRGAVWDRRSSGPCGGLCCRLAAAVFHGPLDDILVVSCCPLLFGTKKMPQKIVKKKNWRNLPLNRWMKPKRTFSSSCDLHVKWFLWTLRPFEIGGQNMKYHEI